MQVSAINPAEHSKSYVELSKNDIEKAEKLSQMLKNYNDSFDYVTENENGEEIKRKSLLGTLGTIALGSFVIFKITKKGLSCASSLTDDIAKYTKKIAENEKVQQFTTNLAASVSSTTNKNIEKVSNFVKKFTQSEKAQNLIKTVSSNKAGQAIINVSKKAQDKISAINLEGAKEFIKKADKETISNIIAGATSAGVTGYVACTDGNGDGIPDIAQKGINAYKNALSHVDAIKDIVEMVS